METKNEIKYIPMYKSYIDAVAKLTPEDRLAIYEAIFEYGFTGVEPKFDNPYLEMGWNLVKPNLVNNIANMEKNAKNGAKGGRPKKETTPSTEIQKEVSKEDSKELLKETERIIPEAKEEFLQEELVEPKSFLQELEEDELEEDEDEVKNYSTITLTLNNQVVVSIPEEMVNYFKNLSTVPLKELKNSKGQYDFEYILTKMYDSNKRTAAILKGV